MTFKSAVIEYHLREFAFGKLFNELGWDKPGNALDLSVGGHAYHLDPVAEKRGLQVFECRIPAAEEFPDSATRRKIDREVTKSAFEHLLIFTDAARSRQTWQWARREAGAPSRCREHSYFPGQSGDRLVRKLQNLAVSIKEEEDLGITDVRTSQAFYIDKVTKRFFKSFQQEHGNFLSFIEGINDTTNRAWYASLMLNRLMFVYFIQKKRFLDDDPDYLRHKLQAVQAKRGKNQFVTFYRHFLRRLFHEGLGQRPTKRGEDLDGLLGKVPYLNGGLFDVHDLERDNPDIEIADDAFEKLFDFFDEYEWHLDDRPLRDDKEINPDVLGYIFEKYVNQKQMGAYYTKEDITGYIARNTLLPFLLNEARKRCAIAFEADGLVWKLLRDDPDRYIYGEVRKGVDLPLPPDVAAGLADVTQRDGWNRAAADEFALPTETWREHVARRQRCLELRNRLRAGQVVEVNELITLNLDIRQFTQDVIDQCECADLLTAFYKVITSVSVLDPTCGSGAFLFAALNLLEPLYDACLERMESFIDEATRADEAASRQMVPHFRAVLDSANAHPSRRYFILKSILVRNLYGVDIMEEAVEICKLRLFLKLVAQIDKATQLEPLPDIDFNIRAGNALVGITTLEDVRKSAEPFTREQMLAIHKQAEAIDARFRAFREMRTEFGPGAAEAKAGLRGDLGKLREKLDCYLAEVYEVDSADAVALAEWRKSHRPFHWAAEFSGIITRGGFDVVIGNPPYLEPGKLEGKYNVVGYRTAGARDIYAWVVERSIGLRSRAGVMGLIVPVSISSSGSFDHVRELLATFSPSLWLSHFANRPGQLFVGAQNRLTILISSNGQSQPCCSTRYHRWDARGGGREGLFATKQYLSLGDRPRRFHGLYPKIGSPEALSVLQKLERFGRLGDRFVKRVDYPVYWVRVPGYFCQFFLRAPKVRPANGGPERDRGELKAVCLPNESDRKVVFAALNSSTFALYYSCYADGRHINPSDVLDFPFDPRRLDDPSRRLLETIAADLEESMRKNTARWRKSGLLIDSLNSGPTKPILDEIDRVLANYYGFTAEELDFILNYDIKYRMGQDDESESDE